MNKIIIKTICIHFYYKWIQCVRSSLCRLQIMIAHVAWNTVGNWMVYTKITFSQRQTFSARKWSNAVNATKMYHHSNGLQSGCVVYILGFPRGCWISTLFVLLCRLPYNREPKVLFRMCYWQLDELWWGMKPIFSAWVLSRFFSRKIVSSV